MASNHPAMGYTRKAKNDFFTRGIALIPVLAQNLGADCNCWSTNFRKSFPCCRSTSSSKCVSMTLTIFRVLSNKRSVRLPFCAFACCHLPISRHANIAIEKIDAKHSPQAIGSDVGGVNNATSSSITDKLTREHRMTVDEARMILNVKKDDAMDRILQVRDVL